jgi:hypothetical protein
MQGVLGMTAAIALSKQSPAEVRQFRTKKSDAAAALRESFNTRDWPV